jgi:hypothetical protein
MVDEPWLERRHDLDEPLDREPVLRLLRGQWREGLFDELPGEVGQRRRGRPGRLDEDVAPVQPLSPGALVQVRIEIDSHLS